MAISPSSQAQAQARARRHAEGEVLTFDLASVEGTDTADLEAGADLGRKPALGAAQDNVEKFLARRHRLDVLPRSLHRVGVPGGSKRQALAVGREWADRSLCSGGGRFELDGT
jgi:hypothetical protein